MSTDGNPFGGKTPHGYVPLSDIEREFLSRLIEAQDLLVEIEDWGFVEAPQIRLGEYRLIIDLRLLFQKPEQPMMVDALTFVLKMRNGHVLHRERMPTIALGESLVIFAGLEISMEWQIGITAIDPNVIRAYMPGAHGLTSASIDKDTGAVSIQGNRRLSPQQRAFARLIEAGQRALKAGVN